MLGLTACNQSCERSTNTEPAKPVDLAQQGKGIYMGSCTACHSTNPKIDGSVGPAVHGASLELITARVLHAAYPPGYTPKRQTKVMPAMPYLEKDLPALQAYLNQ